MWKSVACCPGDGGWERPSTCKAIVAVGWMARPAFAFTGPVTPGRADLGSHPALLPPPPRLPPSVPPCPRRRAAGPGRKVSPAPRPPAPPRRPLRTRVLRARAAHGGGARSSPRLRPPSRLSKVQAGVPTVRGAGWSRAAGAARPGSPRRPAMRPSREMLKPP